MRNRPLQEETRRPTPATVAPAPAATPLQRLQLAVDACASAYPGQFDLAVDIAVGRMQVHQIRLLPSSWRTVA